MNANKINADDFKESRHKCKFRRGKSVERINRIIQSNSECYQIIKGMLWNRKIPKQCRTTVCKVYFKPILTCSILLNMNMSGTEAK
jgi:hypothetical protein